MKHISKLLATGSLQDLNAVVEKINDSVTDKRFSEQKGEGAGPGADWLTQDDLAALNLGKQMYHAWLSPILSLFCDWENRIVRQRPLSLRHHEVAV